MLDELLFGEIDTKAVAVGRSMTTIYFTTSFESLKVCFETLTSPLLRYPHTSNVFSPVIYTMYGGNF